MMILGSDIESGFGLNRLGLILMKVQTTYRIGVNNTNAR